MKKITCLVLALLLCLCGMAMAGSTPSKSVTDLTQFEVTAENQPADPGIYLLPVSEVALGESLSNFQERIDIGMIEIEKLAASGDISAYFGSVLDIEGNTAALNEMLNCDENELKVFEFVPIISGGFKDDCGNVTANLLFSTPYEENEHVLILIGLVTLNEDRTQTVAWYAFDGVGLESVEAYGYVQVILSQDIVLAIQNGVALLAVVSK